MTNPRLYSSWYAETTRSSQISDFLNLQQEVEWRPHSRRKQSFCPYRWHSRPSRQHRGIVEIVRLNVAERLTTQFILGCNYCDKHVEIIRPRKRIVAPADATPAPIIRKPASRAKYANKSTNRLDNVLATKPRFSHQPYFNQKHKIW